jgi:predicted NAD/FAD-binding protein
LRTKIKETMGNGKRIAIVGSGVSGLAALWALKDSEHEVHLYEQGDRLGGHTNTVSFEGPAGDGAGGAKVDVDTGFIVLNTATYPNFLRFLDCIGVAPVRTEMTFGVSRDAGLFEWAGTSLAAVFAQRSNLGSARMWRLLFDVVRFNLFATDVLREEDESEAGPVEASEGVLGTEAELSIGEYLEREGYSDTFRDDYLIPMTAAVWSTSPDKCSLQFPAVTLIRFMWNHHLLSTVAKRPDWMTIPGGSKRYVDRVMLGFPKDRTHLGVKVTGLTPTKGGSVVLTTAGGSHATFDHVVLATHGDQALDILRPVATAEEEEILSGFQTSRNIAVLHSDLSLMPRRRVAWSAWNYITESPFPPTGSANVSKVCLTYWMNLLQHIPEPKYGPVLVTLNPLKMPDPRLSQGIWEYEHPLYNATAIRSQKLLGRIQNTRGISYCGAWTKYGFHEDGFSSGLAVAKEHLGAKLPFEFVDSTFSRGRRPVVTKGSRVARLVVASIQVVIVCLVALYDISLAHLDALVARRRKLA